MIGRVGRLVWRFIRWYARCVRWWWDDVHYMLRAISKAPQEGPPPAFPWPRLRRRPRADP
jgi:hypothetical protein